MSPTYPRPRREFHHTLAQVAAAIGADLAPTTSGGVGTSGLSLSTGSLRPGDLFAALAGARAHGIDYLSQALVAGAVAVLTDPDAAARLPRAVPAVVHRAPREALGQLSAWFYDFPARQLRTAGVTGTNGKTTTSYLLRDIWQRAGVYTAVMGTVGVQLGDLEVPGLLTTPEAPDFQALVACLVEQGAQGLAMEVSSHALATGRVDSVCFDVAGFTGLSQDHLDFHATMRDYFEAKALLFTPGHARQAVVSIDDVWGRELAERARIDTARFSAAGGPGDYVCEVGHAVHGTQRGVLHVDGMSLDFEVDMPGEFNVINAAMALAMAHAGGLDATSLAQVVGAGPLNPQVPGRMEVVGAALPGPHIIVDFAHNPSALAAALRAARAITPGQVHVVFGATGERDVAKRPLMGQVATQLADVVWLTDDDPHGEDRAAIRAQVKAGAHGPARLAEVADRAEAIRAAIGAASDADTVVVAGRGHETIQEIAGVDVPLDDRAEVIKAKRAWPGRVVQA